jgi:alpha-galactosidase
MTLCTDFYIYFLAGFFNRDYSFFEHSGEKGFIHSSSYTQFRDVRNNVTFLGSLAEESGYTYFKSDFNSHTLTIYKDVTGKVLKPNQEIDIIKVLVLHGKDKEREIWDTYSSYFKDERTISGNENPKRHVNGWTSWYYYYDHVTEEIVHKNLDAITHYKYPIDIFQIDDGYQLAIGDWLEVNNKFPGGMKDLAAKIKSHGIMAGLWLAPYAIGFNSRIVKDHPDWILKEEHDSSKMVVAGKPFIF